MCGAACGVWRCGAFVHKYSYARAYLFIRHVLNSARIACKSRQTASGVFMRLFSMYGYVADIQRVAPFSALIGFFPACGRASFMWWRSLYRCAEKLFQRCGKGSSASLTALTGVAVCIFMRFRCVSGRPRFPVYYFLLSIFFTVRRHSAVLPCALSAPVKAVTG